MTVNQLISALGSLPNEMKNSPVYIVDREEEDVVCISVGYNSSGRGVVIIETTPLDEPDEE